jgi:hypothetical protein
MIDFLLAAALVAPLGVPSSVRAGCEEEGLLIERIKIYQVAGKTVAGALEALAHLGYDLANDEPEAMRAIIRVTYDTLGTPEDLGKREYAGCLKRHEE